MRNKTISIVIPHSLNDDLQLKAKNVGIPRSRFICNILLRWQEKNNSSAPTINNCANRGIDGSCLEFGLNCQVDQDEAETCSGYKGKN